MATKKEVTRHLAKHHLYPDEIQEMFLEIFRAIIVKPKELKSQKYQRHVYMMWQMYDYFGELEKVEDA